MINKIKIWIIDDSVMDAYLLKNLLISFNYLEDIILFHNPVEALENVKKKIRIPDLIFLDLNMPEMHGYEFLESFIKIPDPATHNCKIVIVTSSDCPKDIERSAQYPQIIDFIIKPPQRIDFMTKENLSGLMGGIPFVDNQDI